MDLLEVANRRAVPGILIFNHTKEAIFFNPVALGIFSKLSGQTVNGHSTSLVKNAGVTIPQEISTLYENIKKSYLSSLEHNRTPVAPQVALFSIQDATYCCRGFSLDGDDQMPETRFHVMIMIEKISHHRQIDLEKLRKRFLLTTRQMEIIRHLFSGLTNRQIADKLCVSEDTIKGHLKHVMRRLRVNTRTEILSLILQL